MEKILKKNNAVLFKALIFQNVRWKITDPQIEAHKPLDVGDGEAKLQPFLINTDSALKGLLNLLVEVVVLIV